MGSRVRLPLKYVAVTGFVTLWMILVTKSNQC